MALVLDTVTVEGNINIGGDLVKGGNTISLPSSSDTIVLLNQSQILTNKTLSGSSNTFSNIATTTLTGTLQATQFPALTGHITTTAGSLATTIGTGVVTNAMLAGSITFAKLVGTDITAVGTLLDLTVTNPISGSITGNAATVTTNANLTGPVTSSGNATSVSTNAITNTMLAQVATQTFKGRTTAATGNVEDLTATQATAILNPFVGDAGAGGTKGLVPAPTIGDATKYLKGDGTWGTINTGTVTSVSVVTANGVSGSVATATTTPAITLTLGAITPSSVAASGTVTGSNLSGTNTGDAIFGTQYQYAESEGASTNNTTTMTTKVTFTTPTIPAGNYRIGYSYQWQHSAANSDFRAQVRVDGTNIHSHNEEPSDVTSVMAVGGFKMSTLTNAAHTVDIQFASEGATATISNARIEIWRVS